MRIVSEFSVKARQKVCKNIVKPYQNRFWQMQRAGIVEKNKTLLPISLNMANAFPIRLMPAGRKPSLEILPLNRVKFLT